jgi:IS30 family transposase
MKHLTCEQRYGISLMLQEGKSRQDIAKASGNSREIEISFYFCKPFHSWERGANENMNGLIRQYIPKGTDFSEITDEFVAWVENKLNNRPRKRLGYLTPNEKFNLLLTG